MRKQKEFAAGSGISRTATAATFLWRVAFKGSLIFAENLTGVMPENLYTMAKRKSDENSIPLRMFTAGTAACLADLATFPLDTAKVRLQVQGEKFITENLQISASHYRGMFKTIMIIAREEGTRSLYNGLQAGLQRQLCFSSVRLGLYDPVKSLYQKMLYGSEIPDNMQIFTRVSAGITTGALAVVIAQPTDVVKVRFQAQKRGRYNSTVEAYKLIAKEEGCKGLWKGTMPNIGRNAIVNVSETVCYDVIKEAILRMELMDDNVPCHFSSAVVAGFCTTIVSSPVDVIKTRYMNSRLGEYKGAIDCTIRTVLQEGPLALYKGFTPSFCRLVSWNIVTWLTYEQLKNLFGLC